ncbi:hypothetical protein CDD83_3493 [Cordyceps sp. RAO-2017]|nr:hypothetical protein CDD83_3493 [Cordyceps sp. RAO-2017]
MMRARWAVLAISFLLHASCQSAPTRLEKRVSIFYVPTPEEAAPSLHQEGRQSLPIPGEPEGAVALEPSNPEGQPQVPPHDQGLPDNESWGNNAFYGSTEQHSRDREQHAQDWNGVDTNEVAQDGRESRGSGIYNEIDNAAAGSEPHDQPPPLPPRPPRHRFGGPGDQQVGNHHSPDPVSRGRKLRVPETQARPESPDRMYETVDELSRAGAEPPASPDHTYETVDELSRAGAEPPASPDHTYETVGGLGRDGEPPASPDHAYARIPEPDEGRTESTENMYSEIHHPDEAGTKSSGPEEPYYDEISPPARGQAGSPSNDPVEPVYAQVYKPKEHGEPGSSGPVEPVYAQVYKPKKHGEPGSSGPVEPVYAQVHKPKPGGSKSSKQAAEDIPAGAGQPDHARSNMKSPDPETENIYEDIDLPGHAGSKKSKPAKDNLYEYIHAPDGAGSGSAERKEDARTDVRLLDGSRLGSSESFDDLYADMHWLNHAGAEPPR